MPLLPKTPVETRPRARANRLAGRIWLGVFFIILTAMNVANSTIEPMLGSLASLFRAALIVSTIWNAVLLISIGYQHGWARYLLSSLLFSFVSGQILFVINIIDKHPALKGEPIHLLAIIFAVNIFVSGCLLTSADIRQLSHHVID